MDVEREVAALESRLRTVEDGVSTTRHIVVAAVNVARAQRSGSEDLLGASLAILEEAVQNYEIGRNILQRAEFLLRSHS